MSPNLTIDINWRPDHYFSDYWVQNSDPYVAELQFMPVGMPIVWSIVILLIGIIIKFVGPFYMMTRPPVDVRPITLILDGLAFGGYMTGLLTIVVPTRFFMDCFDCSAYSPTTEQYDHLVVKHFAYGLMFAKMFDLTVPLFTFLAKKPVSDLHLLYLMSVSIGTVALVKINPGGIFVFAALVDGLWSVVLYSYLTFTAADPRYRPSRTWKCCVFAFKMLSWSLILAHSAYFLSVPNCGEPVIKLGLVCFSIAVLVLYPLDFYLMDQAACDRLSKKDIQRAIRRVSRLSMSMADAGKMMPNMKKFMTNNNIHEACEKSEITFRKESKSGTGVDVKRQESETRDVTRNECKSQ
jgi:hypothetical protein